MLRIFFIYLQLAHVNNVDVRKAWPVFTSSALSSSSVSS